MSAYSSIEEALTSGYGVERSFRCHVHDDHVASASVNSLTGLWVCYSCGAAGKVNLETFEISVSAVAKEVNRAMALLDEDRRTVYPEAWLSMFDATGPGDYWLSRFDETTCKAFRLGQDPVDGAPCYPLRDVSGRVLGVVTRNLGDDGPKYHYPVHISINQLLFNYDKVRDDTLVVVEGATDAIAAAEVGVDAVALYGSRLSRAQVKLMHRYDPKLLLVATDADKAGELAWLRIKDALPLTDVRRVRWDGFGQYKDLAEMPRDVRTAVLAQSREERVASAACGSPSSASPTPPSGTGSCATSLPRRLRIRLHTNSPTPQTS